MNIKLINRGIEGELLIDGRLDAAAAPDVERIAMDVAGRFDTVVLNLSKLEYTSSAGLRIILRLQLFMDKKGGSLYVTGVNPSVMEVFEMTGFAGILNFR